MDLLIMNENKRAEILDLLDEIISYTVSCSENNRNSIKEILSYIRLELSSKYYIFECIECQKRYATKDPELLSCKCGTEKGMRFISTSKTPYRENASVVCKF